MANNERWKRRNKDREKARLKKSYIKRKTKISAYYKQDRIDNPEKYKIRARKYYLANQKKIRAYADRNKVKHKDYKIQRQYGITLEQRNAMLIKQSGCCAICGKSIINNSFDIHIDHCHKTNTIRGLLCSKCNIGLGHFKDNAIFLLSAAKYILEHTKIVNAT